jgi:hypothetical protein
MNRIRHASILVLFAALALLTGCAASPRVLNEGAAGPWKVTLSSVARTNADFAGDQTAGLTTVGFCDHAAREIRLSWDRCQQDLAADAMHELGHKIEREFPRIWVHLDAMDAPGFPCGSDELHAALRAAAAAAAEGTP